MSPFTNLRKDEIKWFDGSKEKIDKERFRKMYFEKHFMEEMLKAKNMSSAKK